MIILNNIHLHSICIYTHPIHAISFTLDIKLNNFTYICLDLFGTHIRVYGSLTVLQLPPHLLTPTVNG